jgi:transcriptional regulator with XRE-family HTH domain
LQKIATSFDVGIGMNNKAFGKLVKNLREMDFRGTKRGDFKVWTQADLADAAKISLSTIKRIEGGTATNLERYIGALADAFTLSPTEREEFYAVAGHIYPITNLKIDIERIKDLFIKLEFPASARTPLWDFIAFNEYHKVLWGYSDENVKLLNEGSLGPNLLRVLFDPLFATQRTNAHQDKSSLERGLRHFRRLSFRYIGTERYQQIRSEMDKYPQFKRLWPLAGGESDDDMEQRVARLEEHINHPRFGYLEMLSLRVPKRYLQNQTNIDLSIYIPTNADQSQRNYQKLKSSIAFNRVHTFDIRSLDSKEHDLH